MQQSFEERSVALATMQSPTCLVPDLSSGLISGGGIRTKVSQPNSSLFPKLPYPPSYPLSYFLLVVHRRDRGNCGEIAVKLLPLKFEAVTTLVYLRRSRLAPSHDSDIALPTIIL